MHVNATALTAGAAVL